jgi:hypothetical protein
MTQIHADSILAEDTIAAGVRAMEDLHGRHLESMSEDEQADAREHWRAQVERVLGAAHAHLLGPSDGERGRAIVSFVDNDEGGIDVSAAFQPELRELEDGELDGTPAQIVAVASLQALEDADEEEDGVSGG